MGATQEDGGSWWGAPLSKGGGSKWSFIAVFLLLRQMLLAAVLLACTPGTSVAFEVSRNPVFLLGGPPSSSVTVASPSFLPGTLTAIRKARPGPLSTALAAKGRPGGGGGVGPKKKTPQQQAHQKQQRMLGGFGKQKAAKKKAENAAAAASRGPPKTAHSNRLTRRSGVRAEGHIQDIQDANLSARDLPYDLVPPEVFEVYKLFGRLGDPLNPGASLPPSRRLFIERLFKGYTRIEGLSEDQFRLRLEYDWRFLLPLPRDPLVPSSVSTRDTTGTLFEGLDLRLCKAWAAKREMPLKTEDSHSRRPPTKVMRRRTAFLWMYSRVHPPHLEDSEGAKALQPPEALPPAEVQLQEARRRVSSEVNQQGLHPATLDTLWTFFTDGRTREEARFQSVGRDSLQAKKLSNQGMLVKRASSHVWVFEGGPICLGATGCCCDAVLDRAQAEQKFDELIGQDPGGAQPPLWIDASEVPGLLGESKKGAVKSESLQIKHIYPRGGRLMFRNPEAVALRGSKPNPRGLPLRLSLQRLWDLLGTKITQRMQAFDWAAYEALEAEVVSERQAFLSSLRKTIGEAQNTRTA